MAKSKTQVIEERKQNEYQDLMRLSRYSPLVKIRALDGGPGRAPTQYEIVYTCRGFIQRPHLVGERFVLRMTLPSNYPYALPDFRCINPPHIQHPHILGIGSASATRRVCPLAKSYDSMSSGWAR